MAQQLPTDFPIDPVTTSGTALADILNRQNEAFNSSNSGATPPAATFPGMQWLDTSANPAVLRIRNAANTGWGTIPISGDTSGAGAPMLLPNGTVDAPALAFASETGLGWYRRSAGAIGTAMGGGRIADIDGAATAQSILSVNPRSAGSAVLRLAANPAGAADATSLFFSAGTAGGSLTMLGANGTTDRKPMTLAGSVLNFTTPGGSASITASGGVSAPNFSTQGTAVSNWVQDASYVYFQYGANWFWTWAKSNGTLTWNANGIGAMTITGLGDMTAHRNVVSTTSGFYGISSTVNLMSPTAFSLSGSTRIQNIVWTNNVQSGFGIDESLQFLHNPGIDAAIQFNVAGQSFRMANSGTGSSLGGWVSTSDERLKTNKEMITDAMAKVRQLRGMTFDREDMIGMNGIVPRRAGYIAQDMQAVLPEAILVANDEIGTLSVFDTAAIGLLIEAIKEMDVRVAQLETTS